MNGSVFAKSRIFFSVYREILLEYTWKQENERFLDETGLGTTFLASFQ